MAVLYPWEKPMVKAIEVISKLDKLVEETGQAIWDKGSKLHKIYERCVLLCYFWGWR